MKSFTSVTRVVSESHKAVYSPLVFFGLRALSTGGANLGGEGIAALDGCSCLPGAIVENCVGLEIKVE